MEITIRFYAVPDPWGYLGNFSRHPIELDGLIWPSTEHYYQAQKFIHADPKWAEAIRLEPKPSVVQKMGNDRRFPINLEWEAIRYDAMRAALFAKFTQHQDCKALLLATGNAILIEDTGKGPDDDHVWGDGSTGTGQNLLGKALMEVRELVRATTD